MKGCPCVQAVADKADMYLDFFLEVVRRTAQLVAAWQCVGFCHGVPPARGAVPPNSRLVM